MKHYCFLWLSLLVVQTALGQTKSQKIRFPNYSLTINNFYSECYHYNRFSDGENENPPPSADTIFICETPCDGNGWYIDGQTITLSSKSSNDTYKLAYANEYDINQSFDTRTEQQPAEGWDKWDKKRQDWKYLSKLRNLKQLSTNQFKLPSRKNFTSKDDLTSMKQQFGLRDTLIEIPKEVGMETLVFAKGNKFFSLAHSYLRLRVQRFAGGQLKKTNYVIVAIAEGCD